MSPLEFFFLLRYRACVIALYRVSLICVFYRRKSDFSCSRNASKYQLWVSVHLMSPAFVNSFIEHLCLFLF